MKTFIFSRHNWSVLLVSALVASLVGCGGVSTQPVSGTITYEGQPFVGGGDIQFIPVDPDVKPANGAIDEDGTYVLSTFAEGDGAVAGEYRVQILQDEVLVKAKFQDVPAPAEGGEEPMIDPELEQEEVLVPDKDRIPDVYAGPQSTLTATVVKGENKIDFDLKRGDFVPSSDDDDDDE